MNKVGILSLKCAFLVIFILLLITLSYALLYQRSPNTFNDVAGQCADEGNAYAYDGQNATVDPSGDGDCYWWNQTTQSTLGPLNNATFGMYWSCTGNYADDHYYVYYGFADTSGDCSSVSTWYPISNSSIDACPFSVVWRNVTNVTAVTWNDINNTCWRVNTDRNKGADGTTVSIDAFHVDVDHEPTGNLTVSLTTPTEGQVTQVNQSNTFWVNVTIQCVGEDCGEVIANVRRNSTTNSPDTYISTLKGDIPFYIIWPLSDDYAYDNWNFSVSDEESGPYGIYFNGTYFWVVGSGSDTVYRYLANGTYDNWNFPVLYEEAPEAITFNGTYFWVVGSGNDKVQKYWSNGTYTGWTL